MGLHLNGDNTGATACGLQLTTGMNPSPSYSACLFIRLDSVVADLTDIWMVSGQSAVSLNTNVDGLTPRAGSTSFAASQKMLVGVWWFLGFSTDTAHAVMYSGPVSGGSIVRVTVNNTETSAPTSYAIGNGLVPGTDSAPIATISDARLWNGVILSPSEFEAESRQRTPRRRDAWLYWPLRSDADVVDRVRGTVLTKIASGTPGNSAGADPPAPAVWSPSAWSYATSGTTVSGAIAQRLGGLTQAATGALTVTGTAAQRVSGLRQASSGLVANPVTGAAAQSLGGLRQAASGTETIAGAASQRVGGLRQSATGSETFSGSATQRLGGLRQAAAGAETMAGSATQRLGALRQAATGSETITGPATQRLGALRQAAVGTETVSGSAAQRLGALVQGAEGTETIPGSAAQRLGPLRQSAAGASLTGITGAIAQRIGVLLQAAEGALTVVGTAAMRLRALTQEAEGTVVVPVDITGTAAQRLGGLRQAAAGVTFAGKGPIQILLSDEDLLSIDLDDADILGMSLSDEDLLTLELDDE